MPKMLVKKEDPGIYSDAIASEILDRLANGETLTNITNDKHLPSRITVWRWTQGRNGAPEEFRARYLEARMAQADKYFDELLHVARETMVRPSNDRTNANRLFVDTLKWSLAKMRPNVYGDQARIHLGADAEASPIQTANANVDVTLLSAEDQEKLREIGRKLITRRVREPDSAIPARADRLESL